MFENSFIFVRCAPHIKRGLQFQKTSKRSEEEGKRGNTEHKTRNRSTMTAADIHGHSTAKTSIANHPPLQTHCYNTSIEDMRKFHGEILCFDLDLEHN